MIPDPPALLGHGWQRHYPTRGFGSFAEVFEFKHACPQDHSKRQSSSL
jgi:hypothetical protein